MLNYSIQPVSYNSKTGPITTTASSMDTCPSACPLKDKGCYAKAGPISWHFARLNKVGLSFSGFIKEIGKLARNLHEVCRVNTMGDLPGADNKIDTKQMGILTKAITSKRRAFTYTHKPVLAENCDDIKIVRGNIKAIKKANDAGFTVNLSANTLEHADKLANLNIGPVVTILGKDVNSTVFTPGGRKVIVCPAVSRGITCKDCKLCAVSTRSVIVGFPAHGTWKNQIGSIVNASIVNNQA